MLRRLILILALHIILQTTAFGWGQIGHRVIGQIAEWHLNKRAAKKVKQILGPNSLAMVSTWMDEIRSDSTYDYTYTWHWVTIPDGQQYDLSLQESTGDAYAVVNQIVAGLKSDTLSDQQEEEYLKMLVHLVGDLHQPLHVGRGDDRGGNDVRVQWMGEPSNLHRVWDSDMINGKQLSYTELAQHLNRRATERLVQQWQSASPEQWLQEAIELRSSVYNLPEDGRLGYEYAYANYPIAEKQLLLAGVRLAGILNEIYR
jgi:hypothetical protein